MRLYKIKKSKIDKNGLYANCDIKKGTKIIEYKGKIISVKKSAEDPKFDNDKAIYLFNINKRFAKDCAKFIIREGSRWRIKKSKLYKSHK